jgi:surfactin synthase thioesterase subunit/NAD(P)-dependent dehydrogenase (short-subunit alcohol dehydrogenase family)/acyl carrier protein
VIYLWGLDVSGVEQAAASQSKAPLAHMEQAEALGAVAPLFLVQALAEAKASRSFDPRLRLVTRDVQRARIGSAPGQPAQAPLWGFGRTVALEYPTLWGGLIDLPPAHESSPREDAEALRRELLQSDREGEVSLREGGRYVARLVRRPREMVGTTAPIFRDGATYVITGGLGMMGLAMARWMVERHNVRSLVLAGRREPTAAAHDILQGLRSRGAVIDVVRADVGVEANARRLVEQAQRRGALRGVIHCAGVVDDGIVGRMDREKLLCVTAPKMRGSWFLHRYTRDLDLDFFVLNSSLLSLTGAAGQANYTAANAFLDALGAYRRGLGLPATVINWGPWADEGMAAATGARGAAIWRTRGTRAIAVEQGLQVVEELLRRRVDQAAVTITDWAIYLKQFPEPPAFYEEVARDVGLGEVPKRALSDGDGIARLRATPVEHRRDALLDFVRGQVMDELGFADPIDLHQPLNELGLDSLMSVNVANRLEVGLGIAVPVSKLIHGPSVADLVDQLFPQLPRSADDRLAPERTRPDDVRARPRVASATEAGGLLVFPRPNRSATTRLFCFHYAGGGAATFRPWVDALDPSIELVAIDPPGRGSRLGELPPDRLEAFVGQLTLAIAPYLDKPLAFFGHCLGALLLFETARRLLASEPAYLAHVFVSGARPPHLIRREGPFERNLLAALLEHPEFDPFRPGHEQPDPVFAEMIRHFNINATEEFLKSTDLRRLLLPAVRADFAMAYHYRYTSAAPWDAAVTCFLGRDDPYVTREDALEWGPYTRAGFQLLLRPTAHFLVVDERPFILETINRTLAGPRA